MKRSAVDHSRTRLLAMAIGLLLQVGMAKSPAQIFTNLYSFTGGADGGQPGSGVLLAGTNLYGTAESGGASGYGAVFELAANGSAFTNLYSFTDRTDGAYPVGGLVLAGTNLYGVANGGGLDSAGTVFRVGTDGSGFTNIYTFTGGNDGANPAAALVLSGTNLFGVTPDGGPFGEGTLFRLNIDGSGFTNLWNFTGNSDGGQPAGGLVLSGANLYGTAEFGGNPGVGYGTIFKIGTAGGLAVLHTFTNGDGANPVGTLWLSGTNLYGTATDGGLYGNGTVFSLGINGGGFSTLHHFTAASAPAAGGATTNYDGISPQGVMMAGTNLYGTAQFGGLYGNGTLFVLNGTNLTTIHAFTGGADGAEPAGELTASNDLFYGTAAYGGDADAGTVFSLALVLPVAPLITGSHLSGSSLIIDATATQPGVYTLLSTTNLLLPLSGWTPVTTNTVVSAGSFSLTNAIDDAFPRRFYALEAQ